jgi:hypothetical protein
VPTENRTEAEPLFNLTQDPHATPPFGDSVPPSNIAVIVFPLTSDRPDRNGVVSRMGEWGFLLVTYDHVSTTENIGEPLGLVSAHLSHAVMNNPR